MRRMSPTRKMLLGLVVLIALALVAHFSGGRLMSGLAQHLHGGR